MDQHQTARVEIATYAAQIAERERALALAVAFHRGEGVPWSVIAEALGVTKQAAHKRFRAAR
jgi:hypothetical protein